MTTVDPLTILNPSIVGQAEKVHNAILHRILAGTTLNEQRWITLQLALAMGATFDQVQLVGRAANAAKFDPADVEAALAALTDAGLVQPASPGEEHLLAVTEAGRGLVEKLRSDTRRAVGRAYGAVPTEDLAIAARVLTTITAKLSEELAAN